MKVVPSARVERACLAAPASETGASAKFRHEGKQWCLMQGSNLHAGWPRLLKPLRLPIPPIRHVVGCLVGIEPTTAGSTFRSAAAAPQAPSTGRDGRIRTCGPVHPMHVRYQTALHPERVGLRGEARTPDLMLPKHVRYQLRYAEKSGRRGRVRTCDLVFPKDARYQAAPHADERLVVAVGNDPTTPALSRRCSTD